MKSLLPRLAFPVLALAAGFGVRPLHAEEITAEATSYQLRTIDGNASFDRLRVSYLRVYTSGYGKIAGESFHDVYKFTVRVPSGKMAEVAITFNEQSAVDSQCQLVVEVNGKARYLALHAEEHMYFSEDATVCVKITSSFLRMTGAFSLTATYSDVPILPMKADLKVSSFVVSPTTASADEPLNIEFTIANIGWDAAEATRASILDDLAYPNSFLAAVDVPAIAANGSATVKHTLPAGTLPVGTHDLYIRADLLDVITEQNERNNFSEARKVEIVAHDASSGNSGTVEVRFHYQEPGALVDKAQTRLFVVGETYSKGDFPAAVKSGYTFKGWRTADGTAVVASDVARGDITDLYADWEVDSAVPGVNVAFYLVGANGQAEYYTNLVYRYGASYDALPPLPDGTSAAWYAQSGMNDLVSLSDVADDTTVTMFASAGDGEAFEVGVDAVEIPPFGGRVEIPVSGGDDWEAYTSFSDGGWLTASMETLQGDRKRLFAEAGENTTGQPRQATVVVNFGGGSRTVVVSQSPPDSARITFSAKSADIPAEGGSGTFVVYIYPKVLSGGTTVLSYQGPRRSAGWIKSGVSLDTTQDPAVLSMSYVIEANDSEEPRVGYITFIVDGVECSFTISQAGCPQVAVLSLSASATDAPAEGGTGAVGVFCDGAWTAGSGDSWVDVTTASGTGDGSIEFCIAPNETNLARTGTVTVSSGTRQVAFLVNQQAASQPEPPLVEPKWTIYGDGVLTDVELNGVTDLVIPEGVKTIQADFLCWNEDVVSVSIPEGVTNIGEYAFAYCPSLVRVSLPASMMRIDQYAFLESGLESDGIVFAGNRDAIDISPSAFRGTPYDKTLDFSLQIKNGVLAGYVGQCPESVEIPDGVTSIGRYAFAFCQQLRRVSFPVGVTNIGTRAFAACVGLEELVFGGDAPSVGWNPFDFVDPSKGCTVYVDRGFAGWPEDIPGTWNGFSIKYIECLHDEGGALVGEREATCTQDGYTGDFVCPHCGDVIVPGSTIAALGHAMDGGVVTKTPTVAEEGEIKYTCTRCGTTRIEPLDRLPPTECPAAPVVTPGDGATFDTPTCQVAIACATEGASIYYTTNGATPRATSKFLYTGPFEIVDSVNICAFAVSDGGQSPFVDCSISKVAPFSATLPEAIDWPSAPVTTGADEGWPEWRAVRDESASGGASARSGAIGADAATWLSLAVSGMGTLSFRWRSDCEKDPRNYYSFDRGVFCIDGTPVAQIDGTSPWADVSATIDSPGVHTLRWAYLKDDYDEDGAVLEDCIWLDAVCWKACAPSVVGDGDASVEGDAETGFVIRQSTHVGEVSIDVPEGIDRDRVTIEVDSTVEKVVADGAHVRVVKGGHDITEFLDLAAVTQGGIVDLKGAKVKDVVAREALDVAKGAKLDLRHSAPSLTTAQTKPGLTYTLYEGETIEGLRGGDSKTGDGQPWSPTITVKGGLSGFYTIRVEK